MTDSQSPSKGMSKRGVAIAVAIVIPFVLTLLFWRTTPAVGGWGQSGSAAQAPAAVDYAQNGRLPVGGAATDPRSIYLQNCAACHGASLEGGRVGPALKTPKWPFGQNRDLLVKVIHQGRGLTMPGFDGRLNNQQIEALADYLQSENGVKKP